MHFEAKEKKKERKVVGSTFKQTDRQTRPVWTNFKFGKQKEKEKEKEKWSENFCLISTSGKRMEKKSYSNLVGTDNETAKLPIVSSMAN